MAAAKGVQITDAADIDNTNFYPGVPLTLATKGLMACKVRINTPVASGTMDIFAGAS